MVTTDLSAPRVTLYETVISPLGVPVSDFWPAMSTVAPMGVVRKAAP
jgi:hypothetical protein